MSGDELVIEPGCGCWAELLDQAPDGRFLGRTQQAWRELTRQELGLAANRRIIATGHQTLLWHPGILAKYIAVDAMASHFELATANLVVDQHTGEFGDVPIPVRRRDGWLSERILRLTRTMPDVPMALHEAFDVPAEGDVAGAALASVSHGITRIRQAVGAHRNAPNAAAQMGRALADMMSRWVTPLPDVMASDLVLTSMSRAMLEAMSSAPHAIAEQYNAAVRAVPEAGIGPLMIRDDYVELPLWRIREDGRRMRAYDSDVQAAIESGFESPRLMPRALFMTALVRLGMCDLFVHGIGGARYDKAMEFWIRNWLGVEPSPIAVASATLRLPLMESSEKSSPGLESAQQLHRHAWHDPWGEAGAPMSPMKRTWVRKIEALPYGDPSRRGAFLNMHRDLEQARQARPASLLEAAAELEQAERIAHNQPIAHKRTWAFPLYAESAIDQLAEEIRTCVGVACGRAG